MFLYLTILAALSAATLALCVVQTARGMRHSCLIAGGAVALLFVILGFPVLAAAVTVFVASLAFTGCMDSRDPRAQHGESRDGRRGALGLPAVLPVLAALALGFAFPYLEDALIETRNLPAPVEGANAAIGGRALWLGLTGRGLSFVALALVASVLAFLAARATRATAPERSGGSSAP